jgi:predicted Ser/Thr protein kinase
MSWPQEPESMLTGNKIGPFEIEKEIGSGAMGTVYRAKYAKNGQIVALKLIAPGLGTNERVMARFEREAQMLKHLKHPNIVRLLGMGKHHGSPYFAMEFIDGETAEEILQRRGRLPWEEVVEIGKQVASALRVAHAQGIVHRDLKPANLMMTSDGTVKLTDFGIAKDLDATGLTSANCTVGTAAYMSPEQCRGEREITHKSDLYSLGIMLYELLTGHKPFVAENVMDMFMQHCQGTCVRPAQRELEIPVWLDNLVCQLMEKKPEHRPVDAEMVVQALDEIRTKVETLKSAGVDAATSVVRKGKSASERETARALVAASRKKRLKKKRTPWQLIAMATVLSAGIIGIALLIYIAVRPAGPEKLLKEGAKLVKKGDELLEQGEDFEAWEKWSQARDKYLNRVVDVDVEGDHAAEAKKHLKHIEAGNLYLKGRKLLKQPIEKKDWKAISESKGLDHYHQVLDNFPEDELIAGRVRAELGPLEGPILLEDAGKNADPWERFDFKDFQYKRPEKWQKALDTLESLLRWYPEQESGKRGNLLLQRMRIHEVGIGKALESARTRIQSPTLNQAEREALKALGLELVAWGLNSEKDRDQGLDHAATMWAALVSWGQQPGRDQRPNADDPDHIPWILLAQAKAARLTEKQPR